MATLPAYLNGIGGTSGYGVTTRSPLAMTGAIWYVHKDGSDAASPRGKERIRPLASLAQAHTNASAGDIIVCLSGHTETLTAAQTFNKAGIHVYGEGTGSSRPQFICGGAIDMFDVTAAGVWFCNLYFPASTTAPNSRIRIASVGTRVEDCLFECGTNDTAECIEYITGAGEALVKGTTFSSTSGSVSSQPATGILVSNAMNNLVIGGPNDADAVVFDGGSSGWSNPYVIKCSAAVTRLLMLNIDLLNDSDIDTGSSTPVTFLLRNKSGSARII